MWLAVPVVMLQWVVNTRYTQKSRAASCGDARAEASHPSGKLPSAARRCLTQPIGPLECMPKNVNRLRRQPPLPHPMRAGRRGAHKTRVRALFRGRTWWPPRSCAGRTPQSALQPHAQLGNLLRSCSQPRCTRQIVD